MTKSHNPNFKFRNPQFQSTNTNFNAKIQQANKELLIYIQLTNQNKEQVFKIFYSLVMVLREIVRPFATAFQ